MEEGRNPRIRILEFRCKTDGDPWDISGFETRGLEGCLHFGDEGGQGRGL